MSFNAVDHTVFAHDCSRLVEADCFYVVQWYTEGLSCAFHLKLDIKKKNTESSHGSIN